MDLFVSLCTRFGWEGRRPFTRRMDRRRRWNRECVFCVCRSLEGIRKFSISGTSYNSDSIVVIIIAIIMVLIIVIMNNNKIVIIIIVLSVVFGTFRSVK